MVDLHRQKNSLDEHFESVERTLIASRAMISAWQQAMDHDQDRFDTSQLAIIRSRELLARRRWPSN